VFEPIEVRSGTIPPHEVFHELGFEKGKFDLGYDAEFISWLKEKNLVFAYDGRQSIPFDILNLCFGSDLNEAQERMQRIENTLFDLRNSGGSFLILENWDNGSPSRGWMRSHNFIFGSENIPVRLYDSRLVEPSTWYRKENRFGDEIAWQVKAPFQRLW
jgi:hypothetical protein